MKVQKSAKIAAKILWKKKTLIGVAASIKASGQEKCGGAVARLPRMPEDVNFQSIKKLMKTTKMKMLLLKRKTNKT
jgi:hypothetical protein